MREIKKWQFVFVLFTATFLFTNGFYFKILESIIYPRDIVSILGASFLLLLCIFIWFKRHEEIRRAVRSKYGVMIFLLFICAIIPTIFIGSIITERQPLIRPSIVVVRTYAGLLIFFWLAVCCNTERLFLILHKFVFSFGLIWIIISVIFYLYPDLILYFFKEPGKELQVRFDAPRFIPPVGARNAMMYTSFYSLVRFAHFSRKIGPVNFHWLLIYLSGLFSFLFPLMIRRNGIILVFIPICYYFFYLGIFRKIVLSFFIVMLVILSTIISPSFYERVFLTLDSTITELQSSKQTSANVRIRAFNYYFPELVESGFIGYGYYGADKISSQHRLARGHEMGYLEADLGLMLPFLMYGVQGLLWSIIMYIFIFKDLLSSKLLSPPFNYIKSTLLMLFSWLILTFHAFAWGYHQSFWWGVIIFMVFYISKFARLYLRTNPVLLRT